MADQLEKWETIKDMFSLDNEYENMKLGPFVSHFVNTDLKHLGFTISRYKFVSKMLKYRKHLSVCELGCQEAWGGVMLSQNTDLKKYVGIDFDRAAIEWNRQNLNNESFEFICDDLFEFDYDYRFDSIICVDVIEHIETSREKEFMDVVCRNLKGNGVFICGTPNITMTPYASEGSIIGHINLYDNLRLYELMNTYFDNVFIFGMNDETINVSFEPMCCYLFAVCAGQK